MGGHKGYVEIMETLLQINSSNGEASVSSCIVFPLKNGVSALQSLDSTCACCFSVRMEEDACEKNKNEENSHFTFLN